MKKIAILGFGTVGSGVAEVLTENRSIITERAGEPIEIKYILDLREFPGSPFADRVIHDFQTILDDPEVCLVAEMMGGSHPAYDFSKKCLEAGKHVVTSNKEVVANFGVELLQIAKKHHVSYLFEASVGGGIPVIRPMIHDLAPNHICSVSGILNGTTNYILTKMSTEGTSFDDALSDAQKLGYAEANPSADVDGIDAARKIVILAALASGKMVSPADISVQGITSVTAEDMKAANNSGFAIKLIGKAEVIGEKLLVTVSPRLVPYTSPLAGISDVFNGILVNSDMLGDVMFYGKGAGKLPTASAVCSDIMEALTVSPEERITPVWETSDASVMLPVSECRFDYCFFKNAIMVERKQCTDAEAEGIRAALHASAYKVL